MLWICFKIVYLWFLSSYEVNYALKIKIWVYFSKFYNQPKSCQKSSKTIENFRELSKSVENQNSHFSKAIEKLSKSIECYQKLSYDFRFIGFLVFHFSIIYFVTLEPRVMTKVSLYKIITFYYCFFKNLKTCIINKYIWKHKNLKLNFLVIRLILFV